VSADNVSSSGVGSSTSTKVSWLASEDLLDLLRATMCGLVFVDG
jgi:hypothetical protein